MVKSIPVVALGVSIIPYGLTPDNVDPRRLLEKMSCSWLSLRLY